MLNQGLYGNNDLRKKIEDYSYGLKDVIGRGFSSVVYRGLNDKTKEKVAIKVIDIRAIQGKPEKKMLDGEVEALKKLNHTNIMKCHDIFSTANNCYIITEFCNEGDLENLLKKREKLSQEEATPLIKQILMGFLAIAENGFLHRDLKPANILLKDKTIKIADFGFAKRATSNPKETVNVGSPLYMSPQALQGNIYTVKNDIWSIGVILFEILHGRAPWTCTNEKQLIEEINKNNISILKGLSEDLKDLIRKCLIPDEKKRLGLKELSLHPYVNKMITETPPVLLRKVTSTNENQNESSQQGDASGNRPKILHHRQNNGNSFSVEKQFTNQILWMKFLQRYSSMFPDISQSGRYTLGLRFIVLKQMFSQLQAIEASLAGENIFLLEGWTEFLANQEEKQRLNKIVQEEKKKTEGLLKQIKEWIPVVGKDKRLATVVDLNFLRSQYLSMLGLSFAIEQCKNIWNWLQREKSGASQGELQGKMGSESMRLDFTITYFQLNGILIDNFQDAEYFTRMSKLETTSECRPAPLHLGNLKDLEYKLQALEMLK